VLLFSCSLALATLVPVIERAFGRLDRVAVWHRRAATAGILPLLPQWGLATTALDPYAAGPDTQALHDTLEPATPTRAIGPFGGSTIGRAAMIRSGSPAASE